MTFCKAMNIKDADQWMVEIAEKERFDIYNVMKVMNWKDIMSNAKILSTTWAIKQKVSGELCGRLNVRGLYNWRVSIILQT